MTALLHIIIVNENDVHMKRAFTEHNYLSHVCFCSMPTFIQWQCIRTKWASTTNVISGICVRVLTTALLYIIVMNDTDVDTKRAFTDHNYLSHVCFYSLATFIQWHCIRTIWASTSNVTTGICHQSNYKFDHRVISLSR